MIRIRRQKNNLIVTFFSSYVALIPILQYYKSPLGTFNLATFSAMIFAVIFIFLYSKKKRIPKLYFPFRIYVLFLTVNIILVAYITNVKMDWGYLGPYVRMLVLICSILWLGSRFFDYKVAFGTMSIVLHISVIVMVFQLVAYHIFGVTISGTIPSLLTEPGYGLGGMRPSGFYMEPAHYAQSAILYLCWVLFGENKNSKINRKSAAIVTVGIILSGSGLGYLLATMMYGIWYLSTFIFSKKKNRLGKGVVVIVFAIFFIIMLLELSIVQDALARVFYEDGTPGGEALDGRTWSNKYFLNLPDAQKWYGVGFGQVSDYTTAYMNGLYRLLYQIGYPALVLIAILFYSALKQKERFKKVYIILWAVLINFAGVSSPMILCFAFSFLLSRRNSSNQTETIAKTI